MIWQAFAEWLATVVLWTFGGVPTLPAPPQAMYDGVGSLNTLMGQVNGLCSWVDFGWAATGVGVVASAWLLGFLIRLVRIVAGFFIG